jgi:hypothetical protein
MLDAAAHLCEKFKQQLLIELGDESFSSCQEVGSGSCVLIYQEMYYISADYEQLKQWNEL